MKLNTTFKLLAVFVLFSCSGEYHLRKSNILVNAPVLEKDKFLEELLDKDYDLSMLKRKILVADKVYSTDKYFSINPRKYHDALLPEVQIFYEIKDKEDKVLFLSGNGLWDRIGGYVLLDGQQDTIKRIVFDHNKETNGLGAEISENYFEQRFIGLNFEDFKRINISKKTKNDKKEVQIDGITGATITIMGVEEMLKDCHEGYIEIINK